MASLPTRTTASFDAIKPVSSLVLLDDEFNDMKGAAGFLNGGTSGKKLLVKTSDAADPPVDYDQLGAGPLARFKLSGAAKVTINNDGTMTFVNTAVNTGMNADKVDGIEGANIAKLDTNVTAWSVTWLYAVLPAAVETVESQGRFIVPAGTAITIVDITSVWAAGADSGASNVFTIKRRIADGTLQTDVGTVDVNSGAQNVLNISNPSDVPLTTGDQIYPLFTTRNTASEQIVSITIRGTQKLT